MRYKTQSKVRSRFWSRQFSNEVTTTQLIFDVVFGVVAPFLCFVFDPIVFNNGFGGTPFSPDLAPFKVLVYFFSGLLNAVIAGVVLSGAFFCVLIGVLILPLSLLGLMVLVGVFGFTPFLVAFVYLRNGVRALNTSKPLLDQAQLTSSLLLGAVLVICPPVIAHRQVNRIVRQSMNELLTGDAHAAESATERLRYFSWAADLDQVVWRHSVERDQTRKATLEKAYREITGNDITHRQMVLSD